MKGSQRKGQKTLSTKRNKIKKTEFVFFITKHVKKEQGLVYFACNKVTADRELSLFSDHANCYSNNFFYLFNG